MVKDVNDVLKIVPKKLLDLALPSRGGTTEKIIYGLSYVNATTCHERLLQWSDYTCLADDTTLKSKKVLAVSFQNHGTGENLVAKCGTIRDGKGVTIAEAMLACTFDACRTHAWFHFRTLANPVEPWRTVSRPGTLGIPGCGSVSESRLL